MSYRKAYIRRGLSLEARYAMEQADEGSLDENLHSNVLRDSINYEGMVVPHRVSQRSSNANANPAPGQGNAVARIRLQGRLDIYPDESDLASDTSKYIRGDLDSFYNCSHDTRDSMPTNPGEKIHMQSFGNDPSYNGSKQNLRFSSPSSEYGGYSNSQAVSLLSTGGGNVRIQNSNWNNSNPNQDAPSLRPANPAPEEIEEKAKNYDESTDLPNKSQHAGMFESDMHPDFVAYAKAVIFDIWDKVKGTVKLNSTFRSVGKQRRMRKKWDDWKAGVGPNPNYAARPAKAGYSKHNLGTAIDFNVTIQGQIYGRRSVTKQQWIDSGVPKIINDNGLVWGGVWNNYDPIHMHLDVPEAIRKQIIEASGGFESNSQAIAAMSQVALRPGADNNSNERPLGGTDDVATPQEDAGHTHGGETV